MRKRRQHRLKSKPHLRYTQETFEESAEDQRRFAIRKLLRQLEIADARVRRDFTRYKAGLRHMGDDAFLILDLESYYTIAHGLLKLISKLLPGPASKKFQKEETYKRIARIRNQLIRHAYDKDWGDPFGGFAHNDRVGLRLKGSSPADSFRDPGFLVNRRDLTLLLNKYPEIELLKFSKSVARRLLVFAGSGEGIRGEHKRT